MAESIEKSLEYLSMHQEGDVNVLAVHISQENFNAIKKFLEINNGKYIFTEEGIDYYVQEYGQYKKTNLLGL